MSDTIVMTIIRYKPVKLFYFQKVAEKMIK